MQQKKDKAKQNNQDDSKEEKKLKKRDKKFKSKFGLSSDTFNKKNKKTNVEVIDHKSNSLVTTIFYPEKHDKSKALTPVVSLD